MWIFYLSKSEMDFLCKLMTNEFIGVIFINVKNQAVQNNAKITMDLLRNYLGNYISRSIGKKLLYIYILNFTFYSRLDLLTS